MSVVVKICGLSESASLEAAIDAGADMVGFVVFEASPRHVSFAQIKTLGAQVRGRAQKVALTVDADDATLAAIVETLKPDMLQLHGQETPARVVHVRASFGLPVMKSIALSERSDLENVAAYDAVADHLLFDALPPAGATRPGGHGETFDWTLLHGLTARRSWFLAGGLDPDNVADAIRATGAPGVDVSSGVESRRGVKDTAKISAFVANARG